MNDWHFPRNQAAPTAGASILWPQILARDNALAAWDKVRRNQGAPGVDGVSIRDLAPCIEQEWSAVDAALRRGDWQPKPVRRVSVPKPDGGLRHLGIPTVMDRVVHQAVAQIMTPLWERRFSPHSFAYRRGMGAREALTDLVAQAHASAATTAWHLDIRQFFDSVPHPQALRAVKRVADEVEPLRLARISHAPLGGTAFSAEVWLLIRRKLGLDAGGVAYGLFWRLQGMCLMLRSGLFPS